MKIKMIINPIAGKRAVQKTTSEICHRLKALEIAHELTVFYTEKEKDAYFETLRTKESEFDCLIVVGGDGTVGEAVQGIAESESKMPLAILAAGTVNDFATSVGLPFGSDDFCEMLKDFKTVNADIGECNGKYFVNVVAGGGFSEVAYSVSSAKKNKLGRMAYYLSGVTAVPKSLKSSARLIYEFDGKKIEENTFLFIVSNSSSVGGFKHMSPLAKINDGKLDVCIIKKVNFIKLFILLIKLVFATHTNSRNVIYFQTEKLSVSSCDGLETPLDFDGERSEKLPLVAQCKKGALRLVVPRNARLIV